MKELNKNELMEVDGGFNDRPFGEPDYIQPDSGGSRRGSVAAPRGFITEVVWTLIDRWF